MVKSWKLTSSGIMYFLLTRPCYPWYSLDVKTYPFGGRQTTKLNSKKKDLGKEPKIRKQNELIGFAKRDECSGRENHCSRSKKWTREVRIKKWRVGKGNAIYKGKPPWTEYQEVNQVATLSWQWMSPGNGSVRYTSSIRWGVSQVTSSKEHWSRRGSGIPLGLQYS